MASLVLGAAGAAIGSMVGQPQLGYMVGSMLGAALFPPPGQDGPRLSDLKVQNSAYGSAIPIAYGRYRVAGQVIWADDLVEHENDGDSGSGGGGSTTYTYTCSFAVGVCEGPKGITRIWFDGKLVYDINETDETKKKLWRATSDKMYYGFEDQLPDPVMEASLGVGNVPAYRGMLYMVWENLELAKYGNRIPNISFEVGGIGPLIECPPPPTTYGFDVPYTAPLWAETNPDGNGFYYDEWMVYVESSDEFWIPSTGDGGYGDSSIMFLRVDAATWTALGTINFRDDWSSGNQSAVYDPRYDKVWAVNSGRIDRMTPDGVQRNGLARYDVQTASFEFIVQPDYWFGAMPTNVAVNRKNGTVWAAGGSDPAVTNDDPLDTYVFHFDRNGNVITKTRLVGRMVSAVDVDGAGNAWVASSQTYAPSGEGRSFHLSTINNSGIETIVYTVPGSDLPVGGGMSVDLIHNGVWLWDGRVGDGTWPYDAYLRKWDIATGAFTVNEFVPYTYNATFTFDNVRNIIWMRTGAMGSFAGGLQGFCGINGEVSHQSDPGDIYVGDRRGVMYRRPGNNIYFETYISDGISIGRYQWTQPRAGTVDSTITLGQVVADISRRVGLGPEQVDVSELGEEIDGFCLTSNMTGRSGVEPLATIYFFDSVESGDRMKFPKRGHSPVALIPADRTLLEDK